MFYLLHCDSYNCVYFSAIIGISNNKNGVFELIFNFYKYQLKTNPDQTFENSMFDLHILNITQENYEYLENQIENTYDKLTFYPENQIAIYLFVVLIDDEPKYNIFNKSFHKKYNEIIENSTELII